MTIKAPILAGRVIYTSFALKQSFASAAPSRALPDRLIKTS